MNGRTTTETQLTAENEELRRRVAALQESEQRFRKYFHQDLIGMAAVTLDHGWLEVNDRLCEILGYPKEELLRKNWIELTHPDDLELAVGHFQRLVSGEVDHYTVDKRYVRKDGSAVYTTIAVQAFYREDRTIDCVIGLMEDVTERKLAQEALHKSEERYRSLVEACPDAVVMSDLGGRILFASPQTWTLLGLSAAEELVGRSVFDYVIEGDRQRLAANMSQITAVGSRRNTEYTALRPDGTTVPAEASSVVIRDSAGRPKALMAVIRDITERNRTADALRQSHQHLQAVYDGMVDGFVIFDIESFQAVRANAALCNMLGYSEEELNAMSPEQKHPSEALPRIKDFYEATLGGRESPLEDVPLIRKDGRILYFDIAAKQLLYNGRRCHLLFFHDVTGRKQAQEALQQQHRTLKHLLQSSDHERQLIAYDIHDGLAQLLAGAIMQFQIFEHAKDTNPDQAAKAYQGGAALLRQGHSEARRIISGVRPPILDESGVVAAVAHLVHDPNADQGPKIEFYSRAEFDRLPSIMENAIYRIVQEGLTNARKHSKSPIIRISLVQRGERVRVEIRDWGVGFNPRKVKKNQFGLAGIRERARLLGGKCRIRSTPGEGTSVAVELPLPAKELEES
jgi:PAS domain S-box-containing protein